MAKTVSLILTDEELGLLQHAIKIGMEDGSLNGAPETEDEGRRVDTVIDKLIKKIRDARKRISS